MNLYLIRHGQTDWNLDGKIQGSTDVPLNETGRLQANRLMEGMKNRPVRRIYSSPLIRALETATAVSNCQNAEITILQDLREVSFGKWEGLTWQEAQKEYPAEYAAWSADPVSMAPVGGEGREEVWKRCANVISAILNDANLDTAEDKGGDAAIVSHGAMLAYLVEYLMRGAPRDGDIIVKNASITTVSYDLETENFTMVQSNDVAHLDSL